MKDVARIWFALLLLVALPASAEICRFAALAADNPFRRWLASQEVTCVAAGSPLTFPPGLWNVFARADGAVSATPLLIDSAAAPSSIEPPLAPAATVSPLLPEGHAGVIYVPRRGSALPVDGARVAVPADEPLWLIVVQKSAPVAVVPIAPLAPGSERPVDARSGGPPSILGWLHVPEPDRSAIPAATGVLSPAVRAGSREADPLPSPSLLHGAFFRITGVSTATADLRLEGRGWIPDRRPVRVQPGITVAAAPLLVRATGTLVVHWNTHQDLAALDRLVGSCKDDGEAPRLVIAISKCPAPRRGQPLDPADCAVFREETAAELFGSLSVDDLLPGSYRAEMRYGKLPPASNVATVRPLGVAELRIFGSWFTVYGSLTRDGEALGEEAGIAFPRGIGYAPAETEEYQAVSMTPSLGPDAQITVEACDGAPRAVVLTDEPMRPRARFDIDIPGNELEVQVRDTFTTEALAGATVKLDAMSMRPPPRVVFTTTRTAGDDGIATLSAVPMREIRLTISHAGYETRKIDPFTMPKRGRHKVDAQLVPLRGSRGKIVSDRPFVSGTVMWFSPAGSETERAELAADGTFVHTNWHTPDETMAVVSASHPLWVLPAPATERRQSIGLRFPDAPSAAFEVWLTAAVPPNETRSIGILIGGVPVPQPALAQHQTLRLDPPLLRGSGPQRFRDLLATGPIDVQLDDETRQRVGVGEKDVVFTLK